MPNEFPRVTRKNNIASFEMKAPNGYRHVIRVPAARSTDPAKNALPLLKRLWPFEITPGDRVKKLIRNYVLIHDAWLAIIYGITPDEFPYKAKCRNHNWLDWTGGNIYIEWDGADEQRQKNFESQTNGRVITDGMREILSARRESSLGLNDIQSDICEIIEETRQVPVAPRRAKGFPPDYHRPLGGLKLFDNVAKLETDSQWSGGLGFDS